MSVIAFKIFENKIQVGYDGRCLISDDRIVDENFKKAYKISDSLIIGVTGLATTCDIFKKFVETNKYVFESMNCETDGIPLFKRFKDYIIENYGFTEESFKEFGGFLVVNNHFHGVFYYSDSGFPYCVYQTFNTAAFGSSGVYTSALLDCGLEIDEAIKKSAEKYTSINGNVTLLEIDYND